MGQPESEIRLPDRVRAARLLDSYGQVMIMATAQRGSDRLKFEGCATVTLRDRPVLEWLRRTWGGLIVNGAIGQRGQGAFWQVKGSRQAGAFLLDVRRFCGVRRPWIDTTLEFLEFQKAHHGRYGSKGLPVEVYLQQLAMRDRQQALLNLERDRPVLRVLEGAAG